jgi:hypothetical protein
LSDRGLRDNPNDQKLTHRKVRHRGFPILLAGHVEVRIEDRVAERSRRLAAAFVEHVADRDLCASFDHPGQCRRRPGAPVAAAGIG